MKIKEISLWKGRERRFRGPRIPRNKQIGFHKKMKDLLDAAIDESDADARIHHLSNNEARIHHLEDLVVFNGSKGGRYAIQKLHQIESSPKSISIKWDGSPAVIFGRNAKGEFVLTDKSGFTAKGYDGKVTSADGLEQMFLARGKDDIDDSRREFALKMKGIWNTVESAIPEDFRGYIHGDLLWFSTPLSKGGRMTFTPNITTYSVDAKSEIGKKISNSDVGIVVHQSIDLDGNKNDVDTSQLKKSRTFIMSPVFVTQSPDVDIPAVDDLENYLNKNDMMIDDLLEVPAELKMADFRTILYTYINNSVQAGNLDNLGTSFSQWVDTSKLSGPKKERVIEWVAQNSDGFEAIFTFIKGVMSTKNQIIKALDSQSADIEASINGEKGGEGYVIDKDVKLVNRTGFTAANMRRER